MAENKTKATGASVDDFLAKVEPARRDDCRTLVEIMRRATGEEPKLWGPSIVGFGQYHYEYASGHRGDICIAGFSPRKAAFSIYLAPSFDGMKPLLARLGKHQMGKSCLYVKRLADVDLAVLEQLVARSVEHVRKTYPAA
jgi:hypothetical protein